MSVFQRQSSMPVNRHQLFLYHTRPGCFQRLQPPWEKIRVIEQKGDIRNGDSKTMRIRKGPFSFDWVATHRDYAESASFTDIQEKGPFKKWIHTHDFLDAPANQSYIRDRIDYELPFGLFGKLLGNAYIRVMLKRLFEFRHRRTQLDLQRHKPYLGREKNIVFTGATSRFARDLAAFLSVGGHRVSWLHMRRKSSREKHFFLTPYGHDTLSPSLEDTDILLHLGESHRAPLETEDVVDYLTFLHRALKTMSAKPELMLRLHHPAKPLKRYENNPGIDFKPKRSLDDGKLRVLDLHERIADLVPRNVHLYFAELIEPSMSALIPILLKLETYLFLKDGARSPTFSWVSLDDACGAVLHSMFTTELHGTVAVAAPRPASRAELQQVLIRRSFASYVSNRMLRVLPWASPGLPADIEERLADKRHILASGFHFQLPTLAEAVNHEFGSPEPES